MCSNKPVGATERAFCNIKDIDELHRVASTIAEHLPSSACVALEGELGAGKTTFVKAMAAAAEIDPLYVTSPTFDLITIHESPENAIRIVHADMYRLSDPEELIEMGWDTALAAPSGYRCWAFIEWPQRIASALPAHRLNIKLEVTGEYRRQLIITGAGTNYEQILKLFL